MNDIDRTRRVAELVKREVAVLITRELNDARINTVTVTAVTVSRDLKQATVYISSLDPEMERGETERLMNRSSGYLRNLLSKNLEMRVTPALRFQYDTSIQRGIKMTRLIENLNH
ncbi:MAG: 30S ribosome-binding factor RbfA [Gammaproteobacteria bacterium]|nr:30S ribosome-binding factor RbfA [Gammaproteobacteria bacterium]